MVSLRPVPSFSKRNKVLTCSMTNPSSEKSFLPDGSDVFGEMESCELESAGLCSGTCANAGKQRLRRRKLIKTNRLIEDNVPSPFVPYARNGRKGKAFVRPNRGYQRQPEGTVKRS